MGSLLSGAAGVRWGELRDARDSPAGGIPALLSRIAYGDAGAAGLALDELGDALCTLGFVVGEATAPAVPFLLELAGAAYTPCTVELLDLLARIFRARQWHAAAAAAGPKSTAYREQPAWEVAARTAVRAGRPLVERLASSVRPEEAEAARALLRAMDETGPYPVLPA